MNKEEKVEKLLKEEGVFLVSKGDRYDYYICRGNNNKVYDVVYDKAKDTFTCSCDNIRTDCSCYHIEACRLLRNGN